MAVNKSTPRLVTASGMVKTTSTAIVSVLLSGSGNCSLSLFNSATSDDLSLANDRKAILRSRPSDSKTWTPGAYPMDMSSGLFCSLSGTDAIGTVLLK